MLIFIYTIFLSYNLIPANYQNRDSLLCRLKPNSNVQNWEFRRYYINNNNQLDFWLIYSSRDKSTFDFKANLNKDFYLPDVYSEHLEVLLYRTIKGEAIIVNSLDKLKNFLGQIENLEDALFLASFYGYWFEPNSKKHGSYKIEKNGFLLNGFKRSDVPDVIEENEVIQSYRVFVNRNGEVSLDERSLSK